MSYAYETDGAAIYRRSFAIIRAEARLGRFDAGDEKVAVRIIHASGMVDVADDIVFTSEFSAAASAALRAGAPILCDTQMVAHGITRARLPAGNAVICTLFDTRGQPGAPPPAAVIGIPVGFVGAAESKDALIESGLVPSVIVRGRRGGSAM